VLSARQMDALVKLKARGITVKVNTIIMPGVNGRSHSRRRQKSFRPRRGHHESQCRFVPVKGAAFQELPPPDR